MKARRLILGILALAMLATAVFMYFAQAGNASGAWMTGMTGILGRVGIVLFTIFLAWPTLEKHADRLPLFMVGTLLAGLLFFAIRPQLGRVIVVLVIVLLAVHFGLRFVSSRFGGRQP